jgi:hypothetical protein
MTYPYGLRNPGPPSSPDDVVVTAGQNQITATWTPTAHTKRYRVRLKQGATIVEEISTTEPTYTKTGLTAGTDYSVEVSASSVVGMSTATVTESVAPLPATPSTPTGLTVTPGVTQLAASWNVSSGATSYDVRLNGGTPVNVSGTTHTFTGLTAGTTYTVDVRANNAGGSSSYSSGVTGVPTAASPWTTGTMPSTASWYAAARGGGKYAAVDQTNKAAYSTDGLAWTASSALPANGIWQDLTYGTDRFVAVGSSTSVTNIAYSTDGITWTAPAARPGGWSWISVIYGGGVYVAISSNAVSTRSTNFGVNWSAVATTSTQTGQRALAFGNGTFVAVGDGSRASTSTNGGTSWTERTISTTVVQDWYAITFGAGKFVALSIGGKAAVSTNGITWTLYDLPTSQTYYRVRYSIIQGKLPIVS